MAVAFLTVPQIGRYSEALQFCPRGGAARLNLRRFQAFQLDSSAEEGST